MQTMLERVADLAARAILREGRVRAITDIEPGFRRVDLEVGGVRFAPGQKVQFRVRGIDFRTYTPFAWDAGAVSFLIVQHGTGPAAAWAAALAPGQAVQMFGPRSAMDLGRLEAPPVFIGDETSFALTAAWRTAGEPVAAQLYEVGSTAMSAAVLAHLGLDGADLVPRAPDDAHRHELARRAVDLLARHRGAPVVLTGNVRSIKAVRDALKAASRPAVRAKAHWDPIRAGLD